MYDELMKILNGNLTPFEYTKIEELKKIYTEEEILNAYRNSNVKKINYITKVLETNKSKKGIIPDWLNTEIINQPIDEETKKEFDEFQDFIKEIRNEN